MLAYRLHLVHLLREADPSNPRRPDLREAPRATTPI